MGSRRQREVGWLGQQRRGTKGAGQWAPPPVGVGRPIGGGAVGSGPDGPVVPQWGGESQSGVSGQGRDHGRSAGQLYPRMVWGGQLGARSPGKGPWVVGWLALALIRVGGQLGVGLAGGKGPRANWG